MAANFPFGGTALLKRTTGIVPASSNYSCILWVKTSGSFASLYRAYFAQLDSAAAYTRWAGLFSHPNLNDAYTEVQNGGGILGTTAITLTIDKYYPIGYTRSGTTQNFYGNGIFIGSITSDLSAVTFAEQYLGNDTFSDGASRILGFREWDKAKDLAGLITEWNSPVAVDTGNLWSDTPLITDGLDISGNGRHWTSVGAVSFVSGPTQLPLTNITEGTAYVIPSLPFEIVQVVKDSGGTTRSSYFKYTGVVEDGIVGFWAYGDATGSVATPYKPRLRFDIDDTSTNLGETDGNKMTQLPIILGRTYFLRAYVLSGTPTSSSLYLSILRAPDNLPAPDDSIFIRAASIFSWFIAAGYTGLGAGYITTADGVIQGFIPQLQVGEGGDYLPDTGEILFSDEFINPGNLVLYTSNFTIIATIPYVWSQNHPVIRTHRESKKFYVGNKGQSPSVLTEYVTVDALGNISSPVVMGSFGMTAIAANVDESIVYVAGRGISANSPIKQWDVGSSAFIADLAAGVSGHIVTDLLVMSDGKIIALYHQASIDSIFARIYNTSGTILNTYTPTIGPTTFTSPRLGYADDDSISFWVFMHRSDGFSDFRNVRVSDVVELNTQASPSSDYFEIEPSADPEFRFVTSDSCPFVLVLNQEDNTGTITVIKVTNPAAPTLFNFTTVNLTPATFALANGDEQLFEDVPAGNGYNVTEILKIGYTTSYVVSNGSPHDNITVGIGENVVVTVTNTFRTVVHAGSGIYFISPGKRNDTLWVDANAGTTTVVKIP
jgi:hypothetical protein